MMRRVHRQAANSLQPYARQAAMISAGNCILYMLLWMAALLIERGTAGFPVFPASDALQSGDLLLPVFLILAAMILAAFRNRSDRKIGCITGVLTECDLGFLGCCNSFWLWRRRVTVNILANLVLILSFLPSIASLSAAMFALQFAAAASDATLHLLLILHLLTAAILLLILPLRVRCGMSAIPLCYLKQPHRPAWVIWHYAMLCTRGICGTLLRNRLLCIARIILPVYWFSAYPHLLATEMLLCSQNSKKTVPKL